MFSLFTYHHHHPTTTEADSYGITVEQLMLDRDEAARLGTTVQEVVNARKGGFTFVDPSKTSVGSGLCLSQALANPHRAVALVWKTMPIPGPAGAIGAKHSLLIVCLEDGTEFVFEKAKSGMPCLPSSVCPQVCGCPQLTICSP